MPILKSEPRRKNSNRFWTSRIYQFHHIGVVGRPGIEPGLAAYKTACLTIDDLPIWHLLPDTNHVSFIEPHIAKAT